MRSDLLTLGQLHFTNPFSLIKKMIRKNTILTIILISVIAFGKFGKEYNISKLDNWKEFEKLTSLEAKHHKINERSYERTERMYRADSLYLPTVSKEEKKFLYEEYDLKQRFNYKEKRARYFVEYIEEDSIIVDKIFSMPDTILILRQTK